MLPGPLNEDKRRRKKENLCLKRTFKEQNKVCYKKYLKPEKSITAFSRRNTVNQIFDTMFQNDKTNSKSDEKS